MTILIADDEQTVREYLASMVDWEGLGYELYEAEHGRQALKLMKETHMDLVLLDISMPLMGGLEVLDWIRTTKYDCIPALLTCHDEFEYAKQALRAGCFDYVLKNDITAESFLDLIERMGREASKEVQQKREYAILETAARRKEDLETQSRICYWLNSEDSQDIVSFFEKRLGFDEKKDSFVLMSIQIHNCPAVVRRYMGNDNVHFQAVFDNVINELLEKHSFFRVQPEEGFFLFFLKFEKRTSLQQILSQTHEAAVNIDLNFRSLLQIETRINYTLPFTSIIASQTLYKRLLELTNLSFYAVPDRILCINDYQSEPEACKRLLKEFEKGFQEKLEQKNLTQIELYYDQITAQIAEQLYCIKPVNFIHTCERCVMRLLMNQGAATLPTDDFVKVESSLELKKMILELLEPFCVPENTQDKKFLIKRAILLIQQNYNQDIGLEWLAEKLWVNASYLSRIFSQEVGQSLTLYINTYRIEQAKKLICNSNLKLYEIAERVGFSSSIVFSSVFKKVTGETPTQYKNRSI